MTLYEDDQYILLEIPFKFSVQADAKRPIKSATGNFGGIDSGFSYQVDTGWSDLAPTEFKLQLESSTAYSKSLINILTNEIPDLTHLQTYHLLQLGSKEDYWFETRIDVDRLKMTEGAKERSLREISSKTRLEILSDTLGGFKSMLANKILGARGESLVIGFGTKKRESSLEDFPLLFMMAVNTEETYNNPTQEFLEVEAFYDQATKSFGSNFGRFLLYHSKLTALHNIGYMEANSRANDIKTKAQRMQREINNLIRESQKVRRKRAESSVWYLSDTGSRMKGDYDEGLLYNASIYFSHITELLQTVSNAIHLSKENTFYLTKTSSAIGFEPIDNPLTLEKTDTTSLTDEFKRFSEQVTHVFESLKLEIETTQVSLRNTVEVLKTFLEGKQRQSSTYSSKTLGLLTIVFACFVFIDMISNFYTYYLGSNRTVDDFSETIIAMIITLWPSLIMFVFLYFIVLKKMWS